MYRLVIMLAVVSFAASSAFAGAPASLSVQGRLTDAAGVPLASGSKSFAFRIFNSPTLGAQLWPTVGSENQTISSDANGLWTGLIGSVSPLTDDVFSDTVRWLEITVNGTTLPRTRLTTSPYAHRTSTIDGAEGGRVSSGVDFPRLYGATLANNLNGIRWQDGSDIETAFGFVANNGLWFQADWNCENCAFGVRRMTADGSLGIQSFAVRYDGAITAKNLQTGEPFGVGVFVGDGNVNASGYVCAAIYACPSDARLKQNVEPIDNPIESIQGLHGVRYEWRRDINPDRKPPSGEQIGLIAQEVRDVVPQAAIEQSDGYLAVDYARLVPLLIEGMKEQQREIEKLKARLDRESR